MPASKICQLTSPGRGIHNESMDKDEFVAGVTSVTSDNQEVFFLIDILLIFRFSLLLSSKLLVTLVTVAINSAGRDSYGVTSKLAALVASR